jgi:tRNA G18 (ribose-2'-O)-methylase SpoU
VRALARGSPVVRAERATLDALCGGGVHNGVVCEFVPFPPLAELRAGLPPSAVAPLRGARAPPLLLLLDGVTDPQNLGGVLRSALLLGADGVCVSASNTPPLGAVVAKASSGAVDVWLAAGRLHAVRAAPTWLAAAAAAGWRVLGAAGGEEGRDGGAAVPWRGLRRDAPTVLVLGAEGAGLRASVRASCTALVSIPMSRALLDTTCGGAPTAAAAAAAAAAGRPLPPLALVESFNVSVAAALLLQKLAPDDNDG